MERNKEMIDTLSLCSVVTNFYNILHIHDR